MSGKLIILCPARKRKPPHILHLDRCRWAKDAGRLLCSIPFYHVLDWRMVTWPMAWLTSRSTRLSALA
jgi:hypothetical protein